MVDEQAFIQKVSRFTPEELTQAILQSDASEERVLRIYLGSGQFDEIRRMASDTRDRAAPLGNVVVLHGIMGGELSLFDNGGQSLIWVKALRLARGRFDRLALDPSGKSALDVRATGIFMRYYASQLVSLSKQWNVRPFFYDWRRDIRVAADELFQNINTWFGTEEPVHLIAHSMGGLVARSYIVRHADRWGKGGRLVMLGTPNYGSFAITRLLFGTNEVLRLVAAIDLSHDSRDLLNIAKTFTGAYQMMPVRSKLGGLDILYQSPTYTVSPVDQSMLNEAETFQAEIAGAIDPERMSYVAGFNRPTAAGLKDPTQLGNNEGYFLSRKGDGTVPHNLGLLEGVTTYYVDEEHQSLPINAKVRAAMTELLQTGGLATEDLLLKSLGPAFAGERGMRSEESQSTLLAAETARRSIKEQQANALRNVLVSRGDTTGETVSPEEQALADVIMRHDPLPLVVSGNGTVGTGASLVQPILVSSQSGQAVKDASTRIDTDAADKAEFDSQSSELRLPPRTSIRIHVVVDHIDQIIPNKIPNEKPIDCIAVGHYLRVRPTGAERDLDRAISPYLRGTSGGQNNPPQALPDSPENDEELILLQFHDRGILRGDLGVPFYLPDPRPGYEQDLLVLAGMGLAGEFGVPELTLLSRELCWSLGRMGKKHLATVLIGASKRTLSVAQAIHGWLVGINRALVSSANSGGAALESITFVVRSSSTDQDSHVSDVVSALQREANVMRTDEMYNFDVQIVEKPSTVTKMQSTPGSVGATRISIDFDNGLCKYSALTDSAAIAERTFRVNPKRVEDINTRLLATDNPRQKYRLGRFLLDFLVPPDVRAQLKGSAPIILMCNNEAAKVYWELAAQPLEDDDFGAFGDQPYLGLARGLTRQLRTVLAPPPEPPPPVGRTLRVLLVADGCKEHPLPGAHQEAQILLDLFERVNRNGSGNRVVTTALIGPSKATTMDVLLAINDQPPFDVLHYAGHCVFDKAQPERSGFLFSGDDRLTAQDLTRIDRTPKFVFANACESGVMPSRPDLSSPELPAAFAEAFFQKGVANFICTGWPVGDVPSREFAEELYRNLLGDGVPISPMYEALRQARRKIAESRTWAAYQHYGSPYFRLFRSGKGTT